MAAWTNATAHAPPRTATDSGILRPADGSGIPEVDRASSVHAEVRGVVRHRFVTEMLADRSLSRVEQVAERHDPSTRALQRLFQRLVGVGPKWLRRRYRLHDALTIIDSDPGAPRDLAGLAASLGWCDQWHFTREFVAMVGVSPQAYARRALDPR